MYPLSFCLLFLQIVVEVVVDGKKFTGPLYTFEEKVKVIKGGVSLNIIIGAAVAAVIFVVVVAIVVVCLWKKRNLARKSHVLLAKDNTGIEL